MNHRLQRSARSVRKLVLVAVCAVLAAAGTGGSVRAEDLPSCPSATQDAYSLQLQVLTGPPEADAIVTITPKPGCEAVERLKKVQLKTFGPDGSVEAVKNVTDVAAPGGTTSIPAGHLGRGLRLEAEILVQTGAPPRTYVLHGEANARLKPDLAVTGVFAPPQTTTLRPVDVVVDVEELNDDTGATAYVRLMLGDVALADAAPITVAASGKASVTFADIALTDPVRTTLTARVTDAAPAEATTSNNTGEATVEVTEHELDRSLLFVPSLGGYGAQMNGHVYAGVQPAPPGSTDALETKVKALGPQFVRIFFSEQQEAIDERMESFVKTVKLADAAKATINITYQSAIRAQNNPDLYMTVFANVLKRLLTTEEVTRLQWVTIQNEPNRTKITPEEIENLYRVLDVKLRALGLRERIKFMGGDLVEYGELANLPNPRQETWFDYMVAHMTDILDAYSVHIYWNYWDIPRMEFRLKDVRQLVFEGMPAEARKPVYITEFGVRGILNLNGAPAVPQPGFWQDGTPLAKTNIAAFQQLWFNIEAAQLGYAGTAKWDAYWGKYDGSYVASHYLIGPPEDGWPLYPSYHALRLLLQATQREWHVFGVQPWEDDDWKLSADGRANDQREKEIVAYADDGKQLTLVGLDTHGRALNSVSSESAEYSIGGLPAGTNLKLALWNADGNGKNSFERVIAVNQAGVVRFTVPLHAAFALTTLDVTKIADVA